jgi:tRNA threonylcarbamoyladenosine biosynthesis protein TsaB
MIILAIETATEACSAAVYDAGVVHERYRLAPREHNRLILPMIEEVLAEAGVALRQIDAVAFGRGPGSFTGVRIAAGVAQGIAFGAGLPVVPVSTLAALAAEALEECAVDWVFPCIDARKGEVYCAAYRRDDKGRPESSGAERVIPADQFEFPPFGRGAGIGSGWATYRPVLTARAGQGGLAILDDRLPRASHVAQLGADGFARGRVVPATEALPVYLRDEVAKRPFRASD